MVQTMVKSDATLQPTKGHVSSYNGVPEQNLGFIE